MLPAQKKRGHPRRNRANQNHRGRMTNLLQTSGRYNGCAQIHNDMLPSLDVTSHRPRHRQRVCVMLASLHVTSQPVSQVTESRWVRGVQGEGIAEVLEECKEKGSLYEETGSFMEEEGIGRNVSLLLGRPSTYPETHRDTREHSSATRHFS